MQKRPLRDVFPSASPADLAAWCWTKDAPDRGGHLSPCQRRDLVDAEVPPDQEGGHGWRTGVGRDGVVAAQSQVANSSSRRPVIGHAPSELLEITVCVRFDVGSCTLRNETPASNPSNMTASLDLWSQKPRP